jgi:hypothetical protein
MDSLLITLLSTVACIILPKFLSTFTQEGKQVEPASKLTSKQKSPEVPSFPY